MTSYREVLERAKVESALTTIKPDLLETVYPSEMGASLHVAAEELVPATMERSDLCLSSILSPAETAYDGNPSVFHNVSREHVTPLVMSMAQVAFKTYGLKQVTHVDLGVAASNPISQAATYEHIRGWYTRPPLCGVDLIIASGLQTEITDEVLEIQSRFCQGLSFLPSSQFCIAVLGEQKPVLYKQHEEQSPAEDLEVEERAPVAVAA